MRSPLPLHPVFTIWIPVVFLLLQVGLEISVPKDVLASMLSEEGPHEGVQFLVAFLAVIVASRCLFDLRNNISSYLFVWVLCFLLGCVYIAGEETSWGQHVLEWSTPEFWSHINDQNETNLHNTSSWFDQKPRLILLIGILTGGLVFPLLERIKPGVLPARFAIIYPPASFSFIAFSLLALEIIDKIDDALKDVVIMVRSSEIEELFMFYFILLYLVALRRRILQDQR